MTVIILSFRKSEWSRYRYIQNNNPTNLKVSIISKDHLHYKCITDFDEGDELHQ